jgi:5-methylcytosine-specific restriction endonuclease McrA
MQFLREQAKLVGTTHVSARSFTEAAGVSEATVIRHFGSWTAFCKRAGLAPRYDRAAGRVEMLENLDRAWSTLGRQPRAKEMKQPLSAISVSRYQKEFKKPWRGICLDFLAWRSGNSDAGEQGRNLCRNTANARVGSDQRPRRGIALSLRYEVLRRDNFRCVCCGRSPASERGVHLHVDHVRPWSREGRSTLENLQTLCSSCNLGKSDRDDDVGDVPAQSPGVRRRLSS